MTIEISENPTLSAERTGDAYLKALLRQSEGNKVKARPEIVGWLQELRQRSAYDVVQQRMPNRQDEEWRFTDLSGLLAVDFTAAEAVSVSKNDIAPLVMPEAEQSHLVFINGIYAPELSEISALPEGVFVGNLAELPLDKSYSAIEYVSSHKLCEGDVFSTLNMAGFTDVGIVWVQQGVRLEVPIHLLFLTATTEQPILCHPRVLVVLEPGASLSLVEQYASISASCPALSHRAYFTNSVAEIFLGEKASINHTRYQQEAADSFHIGTSVICQERESKYTGNAISLGAQLSRHNLEIRQLGEATETYLNGLSAIAGRQIADTHSTLHLAHPHGIADQLHKCIADDSARIIFNGKVFVPKAAQQTNAAQLNRNLLLSPKARVDTKPELQITADNVKCTHGATVSQIDAEELFYLQSRGINLDSARELLLDAFAGEILERIPLESMRQRLGQCFACRS